MLIQPSANLYDRVINRINREEKLVILKRRLIIESFVLIMSFFVFIPLIIRLVSDIAKSGLIQFLSLLFSDFGLIMANIGDYFLTLLETAPFSSLTLTLATALVIAFYFAKLEDVYAAYKKLNINL